LFYLLAQPTYPCHPWLVRAATETTPTQLQILTPVKQTLAKMATTWPNATTWHPLHLTARLVGHVPAGHLAFFTQTTPMAVCMSKILQFHVLAPQHNHHNNFWYVSCSVLYCVGSTSVRATLADADACAAYPCTNGAGVASCKDVPGPDAWIAQC
jgi:hypothetical protein